MKMDYINIFLFIMIAFGVSALLVGVALIRAPYNPDVNKLSSYECGFDPIGGSRFPFDLRFYLIAILFIIFDIEISLIIPWAVSLRELGFSAWGVVMCFLTILTAGFIYEWEQKALEWQ